MFNIDELKHSATNAYGVRLRGYFEQSRDDEDQYFLFEKGTNKKLGYIDFTVLPEKKLIFINDMASLVRNDKNYKGIGSLLYEFVFSYLATNKIEYPIQLTKAFGSSPFHYQCGFRFKNDKDNQAMEELIKQGSAVFRKQETTKQFPDTMTMTVETLRTKTAEYKPSPQLKR